MRTPRSRGRAVILKVTKLHQDFVSEIGPSGENILNYSPLFMICKVLNTLTPLCPCQPKF